MYRAIRAGMVFVFFIATHTISFAQSETAYIPSDAELFVFPGDTLALFGDIINNGSFGSLPGSVINFSGKNWINQNSATLPDESADGLSGKGGVFRFLNGNKQSPYSGIQYLSGGYQFNTQSGASFPNISIANVKGVYLADLNDLSIRNNLNFESGHLYLNGWNLQMGIKDPGTVTGFNEERYIVTGSSIAGGYLYRSKIPASDTALIFPTGADDGSYSPAAIAFHNGPVTAGLRAFNHVYTQANTGAVSDPDYVMKTWDLKMDSPGSTYDVALQHDVADEGARFTPYRDSSYISLFDLQSGQWDLGAPIGNIQQGLLTTGTVQPGTYMNTRLNNVYAGPDQYMTVSTLEYSSNACPSANFTRLIASRYNTRYVQLFWNTLHEFNVLKYVVQRRLENETGFRDIDTLDSKSNPNVINNVLYYYLSDDNLTDDWSYYRLKIIGVNGCTRYSDVLKVPWDIRITVSPNPNYGDFAIHIFGVKHRVMMRFVDEWGRVLGTKLIDQDAVIPIHYLAQAYYFLEFVDTRSPQKLITTIKVLVMRK